MDKLRQLAEAAAARRAREQQERDDKAQTAVDRRQQYSQLVRQWRATIHPAIDAALHAANMSLGGKAAGDYLEISRVHETVVSAAGVIPNGQALASIEVQYFQSRQVRDTIRFALWPGDGVHGPEVEFDAVGLLRIDDIDDGLSGMHPLGETTADFIRDKLTDFLMRYQSA